MSGILHLPATVAGPRGVRTKEHGDIILAPGEQREGLKLSDDELKLAKSAGLVSGKPEGKREMEAGDILSGGGARAGAGEGANEPGKLKAGEGPKPKGTRDEGGAGFEKPKAFKDMNRTELDAAVLSLQANNPNFKVPEDATSNTKIAEALQAEADAQKPQS